MNSKRKTLSSSPGVKGEVHNFKKFKEGRSMTLFKKADELARGFNHNQATAHICVIYETEYQSLLYMSDKNHSWPFSVETMQGNGFRVMESQDLVPNSLEQAMRRPQAPTRSIQRQRGAGMSSGHEVEVESDDGEQGLQQGLTIEPDTSSNPQPRAVTTPTPRQDSGTSAQRNRRQNAVLSLDDLFARSDDDHDLDSIGVDEVDSLIGVQDDGNTRRKRPKLGTQNSDYGNNNVPRKAGSRRSMPAETPTGDERVRTSYRAKLPSRRIRTPTPPSALESPALDFTFGS